MTEYPLNAFSHDGMYGLVDPLEIPVIRMMLYRILLFLRFFPKREGKNKPQEIDCRNKEEQR